jgi:hypothetical protein
VEASLPSTAVAFLRDSTHALPFVALLPGPHG